VFTPTLLDAVHQDVLYRVLNENTFGGNDQLKEDEGIVSVLANRAANPGLGFNLPNGTSTSIDDQAKYAGSPRSKTYNYQNLDNLWEQFANVPSTSSDCQKFLDDITTAQDAINQVLSGQARTSNIYFWFAAGATPTAKDGRVGALVSTWDNTSFYGIR
jgi:hypothetical protein